MSQNKEIIAELVLRLPVYTRDLLGGNKIKTAVKLNISEAKTLIYIHKHRDDTMGSYSRRVGLARGSFTAVADSLEQKGLLKRVSATGDRRKFALVLTEAGTAIALDIESRLKQHLAAKLARLPEEELTRLKNALETITMIMEKIDHHH